LEFLVIGLKDRIAMYEENFTTITTIYNLEKRRKNKKQNQKSNQQNMQKENEKKGGFTKSYYRSTHFASE
jgi:hypothetical protein